MRQSTTQLMPDCTNQRKTIYVFVNTAEDFSLTVTVQILLISTVQYILNQLPCMTHFGSLAVFLSITLCVCLNSPLWDVWKERLV